MILITLIISPDLISINRVNLLQGNSGDKVNASKEKTVNFNDRSKSMYSGSRLQTNMNTSREATPSI